MGEEHPRSTTVAVLLVPATFSARGSPDRSPAGNSGAGRALPCKAGRSFSCSGPLAGWWADQGGIRVSWNCPCPVTGGRQGRGTTGQYTLVPTTGARHPDSP